MNLAIVLNISKNIVDTKWYKKFHVWISAFANAWVIYFFILLMKNIVCEKTSCIPRKNRPFIERSAKKFPCWEKAYALRMEPKNWLRRWENWFLLLMTHKFMWNNQHFMFHCNRFFRHFKLKRNRRSDHTNKRFPLGTIS